MTPASAGSPASWMPSPSRSSKTVPETWAAAGRREEQQQSRQDEQARRSWPPLEAPVQHVGAPRLPVSNERDRHRALQGRAAVGRPGTPRPSRAPSRLPGRARRCNRREPGPAAGRWSSLRTRGGSASPFAGAVRGPGDRLGLGVAGPDAPVQPAALVDELELHRLLVGRQVGPALAVVLLHQHPAPFQAGGAKSGRGPCREEQRQTRHRNDSSNDSHRSPPAPRLLILSYTANQRA